mmetsp:Transcript_12490/g.29497  ORF Transcript_12490/g.29497 Transcript_12490/m.29497 type:complete len:582 (-) Transcript_12490:312-2057(-)|eukprot:CAMPEP_0181450512 /NCGR_PEP_ID=MMETSP1110-20121109/28214_1 /TAXON_ID=174948 /ORGANISM="Symbiodinium sp., Strain CCMP421" /LENGTH=581 /DNA_ID=CAMNT_0023574735 /DNA_START=40 /DNA_END=1785 /DNA_ORIENTATION=-
MIAAVPLVLGWVATALPEYPPAHEDAACLLHLRSARSQVNQLPPLCPGSVNDTNSDNDGDGDEAVVSFSIDSNLHGMYCYDADTRKTAAYRTITEITDRNVCEQLCATDPECNYYGWHGDSQLEVGSRCYNCALYHTCEHQRESFCRDVSPPDNFVKAPADTAVPLMEKTFTADWRLTGQFCKGSQILAVDVDTIEDCKEMCVSLDACAYMSFYKDKQVREDADPESCDKNCRIFSDCDSPEMSMCWNPPVVFQIEVEASQALLQTGRKKQPTADLLVMLSGQNVENGVFACSTESALSLPLADSCTKVVDASKVGGNGQLRDAVQVEADVLVIEGNGVYRCQVTDDNPCSVLREDLDFPFQAVLSCPHIVAANSDHVLQCPADGSDPCHPLLDRPLYPISISLLPSTQDLIVTGYVHPSGNDQGVLHCFHANGTCFVVNMPPIQSYESVTASDKGYFAVTIDEQADMPRIDFCPLQYPGASQCVMQPVSGPGVEPAILPELVFILSLQVDAGRSALIVVGVENRESEAPDGTVEVAEIHVIYKCSIPQGAAIPADCQLVLEIEDDLWLTAHPISQQAPLV